jgi:hypothetical protein
MAKALQFASGVFILIMIEIMKVYFIMPFPGSQESDTVSFAYFLHSNVTYLRLIGVLFMLFPSVYYFRYGSKRDKLWVGTSLVVYVVVFYFFNFKFTADHMFYQPQHKLFVQRSDNKIPARNLIIGIKIDGVSKAYPIELIGYHHQVRDTVGGLPVMITYCTVCRTGRVFSPVVDGRIENFRLVGMDHFNAMFEDASTRSWWRQATGEAIEGPKKGSRLDEIASSQMSLLAWTNLHPDTWVMQPDSAFKEAYADMDDYDEGKKREGLTGHDSLSWNKKSWIVGVDLSGHARAYDWNDLVSHRMLKDTLAGKRIIVILESDSTSFHVFETDSLTLRFNTTRDSLIDDQTHSRWDLYGRSSQGMLKGRQLPEIQSYQEYWHSWRTFHPTTTKFEVSQ